MEMTVEIRSPREWLERRRKQKQESYKALKKQYARQQQLLAEATDALRKIHDENRDNSKVQARLASLSDNFFNVMLNR